MKLEVLRQVFEKRSNTKFYQNPFSGNRTDMTKLTVVFRNFVNAPKKLQYIVCMKYGISNLTMKTVLKLHKKANRLEVQLYCLSHSVLLKQFLCWTALNVQYRPDCSDNSWYQDYHFPPAWPLTPSKLQQLNSTSEFNSATMENKFVFGQHKPEVVAIPAPPPRMCWTKAEINWCLQYRGAEAQRHCLHLDTGWIWWTSQGRNPGTHRTDGCWGDLLFSRESKPGPFR
jgi:hypothetical protein